MWQFRPSSDNALAIMLAGCRHGTFLFSSKDMIGRTLRLYGEWAELELARLLPLLRPGDVAIDVGAHVGSFAVPFARAVGPQGSVLAFEPQRFVHHMLCGNIALNAAPQLSAENLAAGDEARVIMAPIPDYARSGNFGAWSLAGLARAPAAGRGQNVRMVKLDDHLARLDRCRLLKIDVEGLEDRVLAGAEGLIARTRPFVHLELNRPDCAPAIDRLRAWNYLPYWHATPGFNPGNFAGVAHNVFGTLGDLNVLAVPRELPDRFPDLPECHSFDEVAVLFPGLLGGPPPP